MAVITRGVARVIGEVLGAHYYSHRRIESLCHESGLSGEPPQGNCSDKLTSWINRETDTDPDRVVTKVGRLICEFMDSDHESHAEGRKRIEGIPAGPADVERIQSTNPVAEHAGSVSRRELVIFALRIEHHHRLRVRE